MIQLKVRKVGKSLCLSLPAEVAKALKVRDGDHIFLAAAPGGCFRITPYDPDFADTIEAAESFMARYRSALRELAK
jgi:putative addiction module antidote